MNKYHILVIEDDEAIRRGMTDALNFIGYSAVGVADGTKGYTTALNGEFDLILLDIVLPGMSGLDILKNLQIERPGTPVIMLTAKGGEKDRITGLKLGADDYVVKPFSVKELLARIEAVLRRSPGRAVNCGELKIPGGVVDFERRLVRFADGVESSLTEREFDLLRYLGAHPERVVGRDEILQRVWRVDPRQVETRTIDMTVARLREKIHDKAGEIIRTARNRGYLYAPPAGTAGTTGTAHSSASA